MRRFYVVYKIGLKLRKLDLGKEGIVNISENKKFLGINYCKKEEKYEGCAYSVYTISGDKLWSIDEPKGCVDAIPSPDGEYGVGFIHCGGWDFLEGQFVYYNKNGVRIYYENLENVIYPNIGFSDDGNFFALSVGKGDTKAILILFNREGKKLWEKGIERVPAGSKKRG
jgi:hypothetical protein